jgi:hypothetical protein
MKRFIAPAVLAAAFAFAGTAGAQTGAVVAGTAPGKVGIAEKVKATATITAIDKANRDVTLKGPQGNEMTVTAGPAVKNFDQLKVGDKVDLEYAEALTLELKKGGKELRQRSEREGSDRAQPGERPGAAAGRQITVIADVTAVDRKKQVVTLRGPKQTVDLKLRDPEQIKLVKVGDQVEATYREAIAVSVEPAPKAKAAVTK